MANPFFTAVAVVALSIGSGSSSAQQPQPSGVRSDIRSGQAPREYEDIAQRYGTDAVPELIEMINSPEDVQHWMKAAGFLGVVGDERAVGALIDFIERPIGSDDVSRQARHSARMEAIRALGFLVNRTGSERALDYLIGSLDDTVWRRRGVFGTTEQDSYDNYDKQLSSYAIYGLAVSGHPRAGEALQSLQQSPAPNQARLREALGGNLDTSFGEVFPLVQERGIEGMYEYYEQQRQIRGIFAD